MVPMDVEIWLMKLGDEHNGPSVVLVVVVEVVVDVVNVVVVVGVEVVVAFAVVLVSPTYVVVVTVSAVVLVVDVLVVVFVEVVVLVVEVEVVVVWSRKETVAFTPLRRGPVSPVLKVIYMVVAVAITGGGRELPLKRPNTGAAADTPLYTVNKS